MFTCLLGAIKKLTQGLKIISFPLNHYDINSFYEFYEQHLKDWEEEYFRGKKSLKKVPSEQAKLFRIIYVMN